MTCPPITGQGHRNVAHRGGTLRLEIDRCLARLEASLRAMSTESAAARQWKLEQRAAARQPGRTMRLQDGILLRSIGRIGYVLGSLQRQARSLRSGEED